MAASLNTSIVRLGVILAAAASLSACLGDGGSSSASSGAGSSKIYNGVTQETYVVRQNVAPVVLGIPNTTVVAGSAYDFVPTATDKEGDTLAFNISNKPAWANFDVATGRLSGTPTTASVGTYANILISVSDGTSTVTMEAFSIAVTAPATGQAVLTWTAPSQNTDGTALSNLSGYKIYYGQSAGALNQVVTISNPSATSWVITGLVPTTWYFSMTAVNAAGVESARTTVASKAVTT